MSETNSSLISPLSKLRDWQFVVMLGVVCLVVGFAYLTGWSDAPYTSSDTFSYQQYAQDLLDGQVEMLHTRSPGYPLFLASIGGANHPARSIFVGQLLLYIVGICLLAYSLLRLQLNRWFVGVFVAFALLPYNVQMTALVLTESLAGFWLAVGVFGFVLWLDKNATWAVILSGLSFGFAGITRPTYQVFSVVILILLTGAFLYRKLAFDAKRWRDGGLAYLGGFLLLIGGTILFNTIRFDHTGITTLTGFNLSTRTIDVVERLPDSYAEVRAILITYRDAEYVKPGSSHTAQMYIWDAKPELERVTGLSEPDMSDYLFDLNMYLIREAPLNYLTTVGEATVLFWFPYIEPFSFIGGTVSQVVFYGLHFLTVGLFFIAAIMMISWGGLLVLLPDKMTARFELPSLPVYVLTQGLLFALIGYTMVISTAVEVGNPRYRAPVDLMIFFSLLLSIHGLNRVRAWLKRIRDPQQP